MNATSAASAINNSSPVEEAFANGWFKLSVSSDGSTAFVKKIVRHAGQGKAVTKEDVLKQLKKDKIVHGIDIEAIDRLLELVETDNIPAEPFPIAAGNVQEGENGRLEWVDDSLNTNDTLSFVIADMRIATRYPAIQGKPGKNVFGKPKQAKPVFDPQLIAGDGIKMTQGEDGEFIYETVYGGELIYESDKIYIEPHLTISEDELQAHMDIPVGIVAGSEKKFSIDDVLNTLKVLNVNYGLLHDNINEWLNKKVNENKLAKNIQVAQGTPAKHGIDAKLVVDEKLSVGKLLPNGKINFYEKSYPWNVQVDEVIGHIVPAQTEKDGTNVKGDPVPAKPPAESKVVLEGVEEGTDGKLRATISGVLLVNGLNIRVSDSLVIHGDVCHRTGNIHIDKTVTVNGYVESGFLVKANGDIVVQDNVEDATLESGSNILIKSGIRGSHSVVTAEGNISVGFAENAILKAGGDIHVKNSLLSCEIECEGILTLGSPSSAKHAILGGVMKAKGGMEVANLGSESSNRTIIKIGLGPEIVEQFDGLTEELKKRKAVIEDLDHAFQHHKRSNTSESSELFKKVAATREKMMAEYDQEKAKYVELYALIKESRKAKVVVHHSVYPGVHIHLLDKVYEVSEKRKAGVFCIDGEHFIYQPKF